VPHQNSVLHAMLKHVPRAELDELVKKHRVDERERGFTTWTQLVAMLYGQLSEAKSLRAIETQMKSHAGCLYHVGVGRVRRSSLAEANAHRPSALFGDLLALLMKQAHRGLRRKLEGVAYLIDSTSLKLGARSARWARFSADVCGAKAHIVYDSAADLPVYLALSPANVNDITVAKAMPIEAGATYVFDLGYYDYGWWAALDEQGCRLVTRLKKNTRLTIIETRAVPADGTVLSDRIGYLPARQGKSRKNPFAKPVREVQVRTETGKVLRILTNDLTAPAQEIADLYKLRWAIELFFRWVKQTLKITHFLGTSENAIRIQIAVALIAFVLLRLAQATQTAITSPLEFVRLVCSNLMHRREINDLLQPKRAPPPNPNQFALL